MQQKECRNYAASSVSQIPNFMNEEYEEDIRSEIAERGGGEGLSGYRESLEDAFRLIADVVDMDKSEDYDVEKYGNLFEDETTLIFEEGNEPKCSGPIKTMCSVADALILQYYEEPDDLKAAFGHELTDEDWSTIGSVLSTYEEILFSSPLLAVNLAHPMLEEMYSELNTEGRKFSFLCGHDSTVTSFLAALGAEEYTLPETAEPTTPIGIKVVFERWRDQAGEDFYKVNLVYQSVEELRTIQPLSLEIPPMIVPVSFEGVAANDNGMIAEKDLMELFENKIILFYELEEEYAGEEELEEAA